ncbi:MAG: cellulase-like family protein, partial [Limisphaerales bacterium]
MSDSLSRRDFFKKTSVAVPLLATAPLTLTAAPPSKPQPTVPTANSDYFDKGTRLTISMWDFTWLHASHPGGAYEDLERRVAEAAERGYNTLRVDCFPSRIIESESRFEKNWDPAVNVPHWGQRAVTFTCNVRKKVADLAGLCRKHGIWLGLDSWDKPHMFGYDHVIDEVDEEREFTRYGEIWVQALKRMREDGVLERAVWIAPMNEVPHFAGGHLQALANVNKKKPEKGETQLDRARKVDAIYRRINGWMAAPIHAEIAREKTPISYSSLGTEDYAARLTGHYDVVDVHFMPGVISDAEDQRAFKGVPFNLTRFPGGNVPVFAGQKLTADPQKYDLAAFSKAWDSACRRHYAAMLKRARDYHQAALTHMTLPSGKKLAAIITESFGPCFWPDHPSVSWEWYKRYNADALRIIAGMDFKGSSLSNYAEPIFTLWQDAG